MQCIEIIPFENALYPLRIIGLNQDEKASGGMAGLTFIFAKPIGDYVLGYSHNASTPWDGSSLRTFLQADGVAGFKSSALQNALCTVVKKTAKWDGSYSVIVSSVDTQDKLFIMSSPELVRNDRWVTDSGVASSQSGVGAQKADMYLAGTSELQNIASGSWLRDIGSPGNLIVPWSGALYGNTLARPTFPCFCF